MTALLWVHRTGPSCLVQDRGRPGLAHLGVPRAGALDPAAAELADRLVGNPGGSAVLEVLLGGLELSLEGSAGRWVALCGAPAAMTVDGRAVAHGEPVWLGPGTLLRLQAPRTGLRSWLAVAGGIAVPPVLGSRSTDTLAGVGPPVVTDGARLPLGPVLGPARALDVPVPAGTGPLRVDPGPRAEWCGPTAVADLCAAAYVVRRDSNRVGLRLDGPALRRDGPHQRRELPSEGVVMGSVQVPPDGQPVLFLADHPTTGGYPVVAVVRAEDLGRCAQLRPGDELRFRPG